MHWVNDIFRFYYTKWSFCYSYRRLRNVMFKIKWSNSMYCTMARWKYVNFQSNKEIERSNEWIIIIIIDENSVFSFSNQKIEFVSWWKNIRGNYSKWNRLEISLQTQNESIGNWLLSSVQSKQIDEEQLATIFIATWM